MATQRYISTSFWDDEWITTLDPSEKLLYLYLMTNTLTNIAGVYKISIRRICFDTGFNSDTVGHIMTKFEKAGKAHRIDEYIAIPSWPKHQNCETRAKIKEGVISCLNDLSEDILIELVRIGYKFDLKPVFDNLSIPYPYDTNYSDSDSNIDIDINPESDKQKINENAIKLAELLSILHKQNIDPNYKAPTQKQIYSWAMDIEKINRLDERPYDDIERVIKWVKSKGQFWAPNVMSGSKLREKFDRLIVQSGIAGSTFSPRQAVKPETRLCPHCHIPLRGSACPQCYANFDMNGKEI